MIMDPMIGLELQEPLNYLTTQLGELLDYLAIPFQALIDYAAIVVGYLLVFSLGFWLLRKATERVVVDEELPVVEGPVVEKDRPPGPRREKESVEARRKRGRIKRKRIPPQFETVVERPVVKEERPPVVPTPREILELKVRDYAPYFLTQNPFPYTPVPDDRPTLMVDQERAMGRLLDVISTARNTGRSNHAVIIGPYGSGKSHILKHLQSVIEERFARTMLACYIPTLGRDFLHLYRSFMADLGMSRLSELAKVAEDAGIPPSLSSALKALQDEETRGKAWRWLIGDELSVELHELGISRRIDPTFAQSVLKVILSLLRRVGRSVVCLLIDEMEVLSEIEIERRQAMLDSLRHLVDDNPQGLCFIFACTPAGWDDVFKYGLALARRLSRNVVYLESLTEQTAREFVAAFVRRFRTGEKGLKRHLKEKGMPKELIDTFPFTADGIAKLFEASRGNTGEMVKYCNMAVDHGIDAKRNVIDAHAVGDMMAELRS